MKLGQIVALYRQSDKKSCTTATHTFEGARVGKGQIVELFHLSICDITTEEKEYLLGYQDAKDEFHWLQNHHATGEVAQDGDFLRGRIILVEGDRPVARIISPSDGDEVHFHAFGYVYAVEQ